MFSTENWIYLVLKVFNNRADYSAYIVNKLTGKALIQNYYAYHMINYDYKIIVSKDPNSLNMKGSASNSLLLTFDC